MIKHKPQVTDAFKFFQCANASSEFLIFVFCIKKKKKQQKDKLTYFMIL